MTKHLSKYCVPLESIFYNGFPEWLDEEIKERQIEAEPNCKPAYVEVGFLDPSGDLRSYRYYRPKYRTALIIEDFIQAVRFLEDRYMVTLPKSSFVEGMVNSMQDVDLSKIKQYLKSGKNLKNGKQKK